MNTPFQGFPPELLAKIAQDAFRPPQAMGGMQAPGMQMPQGGGFGMPGMGGMGMANWRPQGATRTGGDADLGGYSTVQPGGMVDVGGGQMLPNPNGQSYGADGMPIGPAQSSGGSFGSWLKGLF